MTRRYGRTILKAPCCGTTYCGTSYASINFSAHEHWSDGRHVKSLAPQGGGLCRCKCGAYFLIRQCKEIGELPLSKPAAPDGWETMEVDLPDFLRNELPIDASDADRREANHKWLRYRYDTRPAAERELDPPDLDEVQDADCGAVIASNPHDRDVMVAARRGHWRHLNDPFREVYREYMATNQTALPAFTPTAEQEANMRALVALLDGTDGANYDEVAELYRELGEFELAAVAVAKAVPNKWGETIAPMLRRLIDKKINSPVRYRM
jgi:hypothetical protein